MPSLKTYLALALAVLAFLGVLGLSGCGDKNPSSDYDPDTGRHPANWLLSVQGGTTNQGQGTTPNQGGTTTIQGPSGPGIFDLPFHSGHGVAATQHLDTCLPCHGTNFTGGISKVACTLCHIGGLGVPGGFGPGGIGQAERDIHGPLGYYHHMIYVRQHGASECSSAFCHGTNLQGGTGPSCSSCHMGGPFSIHPPEWRDQITLHGGYVLANGASACRNAVCHGTRLQGVFLSGPACNDCHNFSQAQLDSF
jgi:hypothetical protein